MINKLKPKRTPKEEAQIRNEHFKQNLPVETICKKWNMSPATLRRIVGGPVNLRYKGIEASYG